MQIFLINGNFRNKTWLCYFIGVFIITERYDHVSHASFQSEICGTVQSVGFSFQIICLSQITDAGDMSYNGAQPTGVTDRQDGNTFE